MTTAQELTARLAHEIDTRRVSALERAVRLMLENGYTPDQVQRLDYLKSPGNLTNFHDRETRECLASVSEQFKPGTVAVTCWTKWDPAPASA